MKKNCPICTIIAIIVALVAIAAIVYVVLKKMNVLERCYHRPMDEGYWPEEEPSGVPYVADDKDFV